MTHLPGGGSDHPYQAGPPGHPYVASHPGHPSQPARREARTGDVVGTVIALTVLTLLGLMVSLIGVAGIVDVAQNCRPEDCARAVAFLGAVLAVASPWVALLPLGAWAVLRLVRGRSAWWVALLALPLGAVLFSAGVLVVVVAGG